MAGGPRLVGAIPGNRRASRRSEFAWNRRAEPRHPAPGGGRCGAGGRERGPGPRAVRAGGRGIRRRRFPLRARGSAGRSHPAPRRAPHRDSRGAARMLSRSGMRIHCARRITSAHPSHRCRSHPARAVRACSSASAGSAKSSLRRLLTSASRRAWSATSPTSLISSGKARFLLEILGCYPEGVHSVVRESGDKDGTRNAGQGSGGARGQPAQLEELDGRRYPERSSASFSEIFSASRISSGISMVMRLMTVLPKTNGRAQGPAAGCGSEAPRPDPLLRSG